MIAAKNQELNYRTVPDGAYFYGMTIVDGARHRLMMWSDFLGADGTDREMLIQFRLHDITIKGSGLLQLIRDAKRHKIDILCVAPRSLIVMGGDGLIVKEIEVKAAE